MCLSFARPISSVSLRLSVSGKSFCLQVCLCFFPGGWGLASKRAAGAAPPERAPAARLPTHPMVSFFVMRTSGGLIFTIVVRFAKVALRMLGELYELRPVLVARVESATEHIRLTQKQVTVQVEPSGLTLDDGTVLEPGVPTIAARAIFPLLWCPSVETKQEEEVSQVSELLAIERQSRVYVIGGGMPMNALHGQDFDAFCTRWAHVAPMTEGVYACAAAGDALYLLGGSVVSASSTHHPLTSLKMLDVRLKTWLQLESMQLGRRQFSASILKGRLFAIGGLIVGGHTTPRVECYDIQANFWYQGCPMLYSRMGHQSATIDELIYVFGGTCDTVDCFDGSSWRKVADMTVRPHFGLAVSGSTAFLAGGGQNYFCSTAFQSFNVRTRVWTDLARMPTPRKCLALVCVEPFMYAIGGINQAHRLSCIERYDMRTNTWTQCPSWPVPIAGHVAITLHGP